MKYRHALHFDIVVIGSGPGGITAALAAARNGARVLLAERNGHLGGNAVTGLPLLGFLDQNGRQITRGIASELVGELEKINMSFGHSRCPFHNSVTLIHPDMFKLEALKQCINAKISLLLHTEVVDAKVVCGRLEQITLAGKGEKIPVCAKVFIDATGDGDLAYLCGAPFEKGDSEGDLQPPTVIFSLLNFNKEKFLSFLDNNPENFNQLDTVEVDEGYNTTLFRKTPNYVFVGLRAYLNKLRETMDIPLLRENIIYINSVIEGKIFVNTVRVPGCDGSDIYSLTDGEIDGHLQIPKIIDLLVSHVPGFENCVLDNISPSIGVRESRRFLGIETLRLDHVLNGVVPENSIALGGYKVDIHSARGEGTILKKVENPYGIPMGTVINKDIKGLLMSGRCISMDSGALGSARVMPTCMAIGEGAGVLAAVAVKNKLLLSDVPYSAVAEILKKNNAIIDLEDIHEL